MTLAGAAAPAGLAGRGIVCLSSIDWDFNWQGHQHIMSQLAARGGQVLFVENTGVRTPRPSDLRRLLARLRNRWRGELRGERERLAVHAPLLFPFPYSALARRLNRTLLLRSVRRWMRTTGVRAPVVWTFLPSPLALDVIGALRPALTVYYCVDDFPETSPGARRILPSETRLFREADVVLVTSERLRARAAEVRTQVDVLPFGVDLELFEGAREAAGPPPPDVARLPRPVVGYVGAVKPWIDQALLVEVAARLPRASFVLVGPLEMDASRLARCPNVHLLGLRAHPEIPRYLGAFDVAIIPYRLAAVTAAVYPAKLNEYLAMGLPVVSTPIPEVVGVNAEHGPVIELAGDPAGFAEAIERAVTRRGPEAVARRVAVARANDWAPRVERMIKLVEAQLAVRA